MFYILCLKVMKRTVDSTVLLYCSYFLFKKFGMMKTCTIFRSNLVSGKLRFSKYSIKTIAVFQDSSQFLDRINSGLDNIQCWIHQNADNLIVSKHQR